jgi:2-phospho-L-lactate transferase/gluconeogenesis factor (CofD/UPF0052 family)
MTQPGETNGYTARQHLDIVKQYAPEIHFDFIVVNSRAITSEQAERYQAEGASQIGIDEDLVEVRSEETQIVRADLLDDGEKVRHNSERLARVVVACAEQACSRPALVV